MLVWLGIFVLCFAALNVRANTEKVIFVSPKAIDLPVSGPTLAELNLDVLSPSSSTFHTSISVSFANETQPEGEQAWFMLSGLEEERRYEVRVCWAATPSRFTLEQYTISEVFETPSLIQGLASYAETRQALFGQDIGTERSLENIDTPQSVLFLRLWAAADFVTLNRTLMSDPPPVEVDIILDPYYLNIFPKSLLPTAGYIIVIAGISWFLSGYIWSWLQASTRDPKAHKD